MSNISYPQMKLASWLPLVGLGVLLSACSVGQLSLREGVLRPGIGQKAFRSEWGEPNRILPVLSAQALAVRWNTEVGNLRVPLELWVYERYQTELLFESGDLVAWKTTWTKEQLQEIPKRRSP